MSPSEQSRNALLGAVVGWLRFPSSHGIVLRLQTAMTRAEADAGRYVEHDVMLSAQQLRLLGEDLIRAADEREGRVPESRRRRPWWQL